MALVKVNRWFELGLALGLKQPTLAEIRSNHENHEKDCKIEMLTKWLTEVDQCQPSWNALVEALRSPTVQCNATANTIEKNYLHTAYH